jgi:hypothetical protein
MSTVNMRRITVGSTDYLWRRDHRHRSSGPTTGTCEERLVIFAEGFKAGPVRLSFRQDAEWEVGYPAAGVIWSKLRDKSYNLNRPAVVAAVIEYMVKTGWEPRSSRRPLEVDGFTILDKTGAPPEPPTRVQPGEAPGRVKP